MILSALMQRYLLGSYLSSKIFGSSIFITLDVKFLSFQDHYFDVMTNAVGLVAAVLGDKLFWWIDPVGGLVLAIYTIINWSGTVLENAASLVGKSAPPEVLQKLTYLVLRHPQIKRVDTVRAYTFGVLYFVEVSGKSSRILQSL
ncbi:metal tolerance protein 4-like [Impatiens glandulifera]|uniref:metal tolerance protein 4-like n=1 Tax=Impatiens glandulifera TaxID=253017 RepID=UPI001FB0B1D9|nr:metal tolerance protein 4-like [Impatiens glandulifera]